MIMEKKLGPHMKLDNIYFIVKITKNELKLLKINTNYVQLNPIYC